MVEPEKIKKEKKFKDPTVPVKYAFIDRVAKIPETAFAKSKFYPRELKVAHVLFEKYSLDFWSKVTFDYKTESVCFFLNGRGADELEKKWKEFNYTPPIVESAYYESDKIGEDYKPQKIPNLLDFLRK
jgi:hypothetical protein